MMSENYINLILCEITVLLDVHLAQFRHHNLILTTVTDTLSSLHLPNPLLMCYMFIMADLMNNMLIILADRQL